MFLYDLYYACGDMDCTHKAKLTYGDKTSLNVSMEEAINKYGHFTVVCFSFNTDTWDIIFKENINYI